MSNYIKCSVLKIKTSSSSQSFEDNVPINLDLCKSFIKTRNNKLPAIKFLFIGSELTWLFNNNVDRDVEYERVLCVAGAKGVGDE